MGIFERLYYFSVVFTNTMKHIHFHAVGNKFDRLHSIANEYYEKSNEDSDLFGEWAMEHGEEIQNPSDAAKLLDAIVENDNQYNWENGIKAISDWIQQYIEEMTTVRKSKYASDDIKSELDTIIRYWKKENDYKNEARLKEI